MSQLWGLSGGGLRLAEVSNRIASRTRCGLQKGQESNRSTADDHHDLHLIELGHYQNLASPATFSHTDRHREQARPAPTRWKIDAGRDALSIIATHKKL
jgi:hypothetical protein